MSHRTETTDHPPQTVVIGFGNILLKDEGIGVHVIRELDSMPRKSDREFLLIDGGTCPDALFHLPEEIGKLIVVDAVKGGGEPGSIYRFTPNDIEFKRASITSLHQLGLKEGLGMMKFLGKYPESIIIIGVEPKEIDWGLKISPELKKIIPQVILLLEHEIAT
ncbi:MAG: HyaD/HybD family hydrogenase maturation endopeptidase [Anaerolineaceae bacterium]|nr:HyaD/HybD family hydrogenase maturation endopeptidase [Anaerolineaceae bacterium]